MTAPDFIALLPLLIVFGGTVVVMLGIAVRRHHGVTAGLTLAVLAAALLSLPMAAAETPRQVTDLLMLDSFGLFFIGLILAASVPVVILSYGYFERQDVRREELYILLLVGIAGAMSLAVANHFATLFLGLELLSIPLFALIGYLPLQRLPLEAAMKYLILAGASVAFLLFGMALVYVELGTLEFGRMAGMLAGGAPGILVLPGLALMITGFGFKLAVVPFHLWTPDVYQGAPAPVTAFVATVSKGAVVALLLRFFYGTGAHAMEPVYLLFTIIAIASMIAGSLLALLQDNVKRILAYSSIAHLGYILVGFQAGGEFASSAVAYYLVAYIVTILGAFGVVSVLSTATGEPATIEEYRGLFWSRPWLAVVFSLMLLSLAGIPLTAGFIAKYYVLVAGASATIWLLLFVLVATSAIALFYYLRIMVALYTPVEGTAVPEVLARPVSTAGALVLVSLAALLVWLGVYPSPLMGLIEATVANGF